MNLVLLVAAGALLFKALQGRATSLQGLTEVTWPTLGTFKVGQHVQVLPPASGKWPDGSAAKLPADATIVAFDPNPVVEFARGGGLRMTVAASQLKRV